MRMFRLHALQFLSQLCLLLLCTLLGLLCFRQLLSWAGSIFCRLGKIANMICRTWSLNFCALQACQPDKHKISGELSCELKGWIWLKPAWAAFCSRFSFSSSAVRNTAFKERLKGVWLWNLSSTSFYIWSLIVFHPGHGRAANARFWMNDGHLETENAHACFQSISLGKFISRFVAGMAEHSNFWGESEPGYFNAWTCRRSKRQM